MGRCTVVVGQEFMVHMFNLDLYKGQMYAFRRQPETETIEIDLEVTDEMEKTAIPEGEGHATEGAACRVPEGLPLRTVYMN